MSGLLRHWLTRPSKVSPLARGAAAAVLGALAVLLLASPPPTTGASPPATEARPTKVPEAPGPGELVSSFPRSPALIAEGYNLYQQACSSCHGVSQEGRPGVAPSLRNVGAGPVDFYLSTGRMPLEQPREEPQRNPPLFNRRQIAAIVAYVSSFGGPPAPAADASRGDLALGLHEFTLHCAGCHQIVARGGLTLGAATPNLQQSTPQQIAEAVRMGPYVMPHFDSKQIDQRELDSLARYILWTRRPNNAGGWGIYNIGPIPEGIVAWFLALASLVIVARLIGERLA